MQHEQGESGGRGPAQRANGSDGEVRRQISEGIVGLLREYCGRGPEGARVYMLDDLVVCVLRGGFTQLEQTLLDAARRDVVVAQRMALQDVLAGPFRALVSQITGREVIAFMSANHEDPEMVCELFVLAPGAGSPETA